MIPGLTTKVSESQLVAAATITPLTDVVYITGTTALKTIVPPFGGFSGILVVVAQAGAGLSTLTTGNIALAVNMTTNVPVLFVWSLLNSKWYPGAIS